MFENIAVVVEDNSVDVGLVVLVVPVNEGSSVVEMPVQ